MYSGSAGQSSGDWSENVLYGAPESGWPSVNIITFSSNAAYDVEFLRSCKNVQYCLSENGNPFLSIHREKYKYPTPIAYRTRTRSKLTYTNL